MTFCQKFIAWTQIIFINNLMTHKYFTLYKSGTSVGLIFYADVGSHIINRLMEDIPTRSNTP